MTCASCGREYEPDQYLIYCNECGRKAEEEDFEGAMAYVEFVVACERGGEKGDRVLPPLRQRNGGSA